MSPAVPRAHLEMHLSPCHSGVSRSHTEGCAANTKILLQLPLFQHAFLQCLKVVSCSTRRSLFGDVISTKFHEQKVTHLDLHSPSGLLDLLCYLGDVIGALLLEFLKEINVIIPSGIVSANKRRFLAYSLHPVSHIIEIEVVLYGKTVEYKLLLWFIY